MSWSKSANGSPKDVFAAMANWKEEVEKNDRSFTDTTDMVVTLHGQQVEKCTKAAEQFASTVPDGYALSVEANGHAHASTTEVLSDQWSVRFSAFKPAPVKS